VLEHYARIEASDEPWIDVGGRVIDRYEAARARDTLAFAEACARRDREKDEAVARMKASLCEPGGKRPD